MKFGATLKHLEISEWEDNYVSYNTIKKLLKPSADSKQKAVFGETEEEEFVTQLDSELEKVSTFEKTVNMYEDICDIIKKIFQRFRRSIPSKWKKYVKASRSVQLRLTHSPGSIKGPKSPSSWKRTPRKLTIWQTGSTNFQVMLKLITLPSSNL
jgi:hypothetical protein